MRLSKTLIEAIISNIVKELVEKKLVNVDDYQMLEEKLTAVMIDDLSIEDRLDEEVRELMAQHEDMIRSSNVEYHEMFKTIKKKLIRERKLII